MKHEFSKKAKAKGWTVKAIGERWGLKSRAMNDIAASTRQRELDALEGLPCRLIRSNTRLPIQLSQTT